MNGSLLLSLTDIAALGIFLLCWVVYSLALSSRFTRRLSLSTAMNAQREVWMRKMAQRELRMIDTNIMNGLQQGTAFFASSSLLALGGCFALLGSPDQILSVLTDLPLLADTNRSMFELKVMGLVLLLAYSFFKFGWAYRLFNYCSILIGAVPPRDGADAVELEAAVHRAARMNVLAGKHFNAGLRGIFFSLGYLGWFLGAPVFILSTLIVVTVLIRRQFFSAARLAALGFPDQPSGPGSSVSVRPDRK